MLYEPALMSKVGCHKLLVTYQYQDLQSILHSTSAGDENKA